MTATRRTVLIAPLALTACGDRTPGTGLFIEANDHVVAPVSFGNHQALALIDNGAPLTSLDQAFAQRTGLRRSAAGAGLDPLPMILAGASVHIHPFLEDMTEAAIATDAKVEAIAGMELFKAYAVGLAFSAGVLTLHPRPYRPSRAVTTLRLDRGAPPHPSVEIALNGGSPIKAYLDLGCSAALLVSPALAARLALATGRAVSTRQVILSEAAGLGLGVSQLTSVDRLTFARRDLTDVPIDILPEDARPFAGIDAVVGMPLLRKFDLVLDLPRFLHLEPNARAAEPFERRMTGLQVKPDGDGLLIRHIAKDSPAQAAGFAPGERIIAIDGAPPLMRTLRQAKAGQNLEIILASGVRRSITGARYY